MSYTCSFMWPRAATWFVTLFVAVSGHAQDRRVAALASADPVAREMARRQLTFADDLPVDQVTRLLGTPNHAVVRQAAILLRDRHVGIDALRQHTKHEDPEVRRVLLPVATERTLRSLLAEDESDAIRIAALHELEDRGKLGDDDLLAAMRDESAEVADAAARLIVYERSPFPIRLAERLLEDAAARTRLIGRLADRPRASAGGWLLRILAGGKLDPLARLLAIHSLPAELLDRKMAREVLAAAVSDVAARANRAASAAARFPRELADLLVQDVIDRVDDGKSITSMFAVLSRVSATGEKHLFEFALRTEESIRRDVLNWLTSRESKLVERHVAAALRADGPFPKELAGLAGPALAALPDAAKKVAVDKVVAILVAGGDPAVHAYTALIEAGEFRPEMAEYALTGVVGDKSRRLFRLFKLSPERLPLSLFKTVLEGEDFDAHVYAMNALSRTPIDKSLESRVLEFARESMVPLLATAASRAIILQGSERSGRMLWRKAEDKRPLIEWLIVSPKPWTHDLLLEEREAMVGPKRRHAAEYHRVLMALARLGDRGASEELIGELPFLRPMELREAQKLMGEYYKKPDLERLARKHIAVRPLEAGEDLSMEDDERRAELLEWFIGRRNLDLNDLLTQLWETDENYEVRLVALRGLLGRDSERLHDKLQTLIRRPYDGDQEELAFEVVGGMSHPMTDTALTLLARILLEAPLSDPTREIRLSIDRDGTPNRARYPLLTPAANLLRRDSGVRPGAVFRKVAKSVAKKRYAFNRRRLGLFLAGINLREDLGRDLGPVLAEMIVDAPDTATEFLGPAQLILAYAADASGEWARATDLYAAAARAFCRGAVPYHIQRSFFGDVDPLLGRHPYAALAARAPICRARVLHAAGRTAAARRTLGVARDLAEGDRLTIREIQTLRRSFEK